MASQDQLAPQLVTALVSSLTDARARTITDHRRAAGGGAPPLAESVTMVGPGARGAHAFMAVTPAQVRALLGDLHVNDEQICDLLVDYVEQSGNNMVQAALEAGAWCARLVNALAFALDAAVAIVNDEDEVGRRARVLAAISNYVAKTLPITSHNLAGFCLQRSH